MKRFAIAMSVAAGSLLLAVSAFPQGEKEGQGQAIVTILPKHDGDATPTVSPQDLTVKINGKDSKVTSFQSLANLTRAAGLGNR